MYYNMMCVAGPHRVYDRRNQPVITLLTIYETEKIWRFKKMVIVQILLRVRRVPIFSSLHFSVQHFVLRFCKYY